MTITDQGGLDARGVWHEHEHHYLGDEHDGAPTVCPVWGCWWNGTDDEE